MWGRDPSPGGLHTAVSDALWEAVRSGGLRLGAGRGGDGRDGWKRKPGFQPTPTVRRRPNSGRREGLRRVVVGQLSDALTVS